MWVLAQRTSVSECNRLKSDPKVRVFGVWGDLFDLSLSDIAAEGFLDVSDAIGNVARGALGDHLNGGVRQVTYHARQLIAICCVKGGKAKADTLDSADEDYVFGNLAHFD